MSGYDRAGELVALPLEGDGLLPAVEGAGQQHLVAAVVPGEFGEDVGLLNVGLVVALLAGQFARCSAGYSDSLTKLWVLPVLGFF